MALRDVIGQEKAISILFGSIRRNRMPSAYLFSGEAGIGKKLTAVNIAKILNCKSTEHRTQNTETNSLESEIWDLGSDIDACDECPSCRKIDSQTHPDFLLIIPEKGEIRVDEIRAIEESLSFAPYEGKRKVVIVDDAELMNPSAANAFLKTLEEPPAHSLIILVSASPDRLPETIRSRCSRVNFSPLSPEKCEEVIKIAQKRRSAVSSATRPGREAQKGKASEPQDFQPSELLSTVARLSMGRPGLAISNDLIEERDWFLGLFKEVISGGKDAWADREEIEVWLNAALTFLRDMAVFRITGRADMLVNIDLRDRISIVSKTVELKDIINSYARLSLLKRYLDFNLNKSITWNYTGVILSKFRKGI